MAYMSIFMKTGSGVEKLMGGYSGTETAWRGK
jgi:hypothetical protein